MARHQLIDHHLAVLAGALPRSVVDELADGLVETWESLKDSGLTPDDAARAAVSDFGAPDATINAFVSQSPGRRLARLLLFTAPPVAAFWAFSLIAGRAWTWPIPMSLAAALGVGLVAVVISLIVSATSHHSYRRTRLGTAGGVGVLLLDTGVLAIVAITAPVLVWPMAAAIPASLARMALTLRSLRRLRVVGFSRSNR